MKNINKEGAVWKNYEKLLTERTQLEYSIRRHPFKSKERRASLQMVNLQIMKCEAIFDAIEDDGLEYIDLDKS